MRVCNKCMAAENPLGLLSFRELQGEVLCSKCLPKSVDPINSRNSPEAALTAIMCPECRTTVNATCDVCAGYGSVRVYTNAIPVWTQKVRGTIT